MRGCNLRALFFQDALDGAKSCLNRAKLSLDVSEIDGHGAMLKIDNELASHHNWGIVRSVGSPHSERRDF